MSHETPSIDGRYRVEEKLGQGGMGQVYRVTDLTTGKELALKQLLRRDEGTTLRFRREFHEMVRLRHPHIVEAYEYGIDNQRGPYYTMELVGGGDLTEGAPLPFERACRVLRDVASALALLHGKRLIHRDLSALNVRLTRDGRAKLIDFGVLATAGAVDNVAGTPPLIPPESFYGLPLDHRVDLFGLGGLAYYVLTGRHAYPARRLDDLERAWRTPPPLPSSLAPGVPPAVDDLVMSMVALQPLRRPFAVAEVLERLSAAAGLPPAEELEAKRGYLSSSAMIGRQQEMKLIKQRIESAVEGRGGGVFILGQTGMGKSRLMVEAGLEAQVAGAMVASSGEGERGPLGAARAIIEHLMVAAPEDARETLAPYAPLLGRVMPELAELAGPLRRVYTTLDPTEERLRVLGALTDWLTALSRRRPLVIIADNLQRTDEASCALFTALAAAGAVSPLLVIGAQRTDEPAQGALRGGEAPGRQRNPAAPRVQRGGGGGAGPLALR